MKTKNTAPKEKPQIKIVSPLDRLVLNSINLNAAIYRQGQKGKK